MIGVGAGGPEHLTLEAVAAIGSLDAVLVLDKGDSYDDLAALRRAVMAAHGRAGVEVVVADPPRSLPSPTERGYEAAVAAWHRTRVEAMVDGLLRHLGRGGAIGILVWGDPSLYDSTLRILDGLFPQLPWPVELDVVAGVSSLHLLTAAHRIPLNRVGASVRITTRRRLAEAPPDESCDVVVFLDGRGAFAELDPSGFDIYWGAYLGSPTSSWSRVRWRSGRPARRLSKPLKLRSAQECSTLYGCTVRAWALMTAGEASRSSRRRFALSSAVTARTTRSASPPPSPAFGRPNPSRASCILRLGDWVVQQPRVFAAEVFAVSALTLSQSTTVRAIVPIGLVPGLSPMIVVGSLPAVGAPSHSPGRQARRWPPATFDLSGMTSLGALLIDSSFAVPIATVVLAVLAGLVIGQLV